MTGIVLAGGLGTRLRPLTLVANKHLLPVYDKPMIYYPIETLKEFGCDRIVLVSGGEHIGGFAELLGDGASLGVTITYRVQNEANGIAGALLCAEGLVSDAFPVILGDNYFGHAPRYRTRPTIYVSEVPDPQRFGVYANGRITEKPQEPESNGAVVGFYIYDRNVFDYIKTLEPSARDELEITSVNNWYLEQGCEALQYDGFWRDMGTFDTLLEVANHVQ